MSTDTTENKAGDSALDPISRISEILFGLIMVLTFTGSLSAIEAGREDVKEMLIGAAGCNLAWGIIDALLYLMSCITNKGRINYAIKNLKAAEDASAARKIVTEALPDGMTEILEPADLDRIKDRILERCGYRLPRIFSLADLTASLKVFLLVFLSMFPVLVPFLVINDPYPALRLSNLIALLMLFGLGRELGRYAGRTPWLWGICITVVGAVIVSMTIALGG